MKREIQQGWFLGGCLIELSLVGVAALVAWGFGRSLLTNFSWDAQDALWGVAATLPILGIFVWTLGSNAGPLREIRDFLDQLVYPVFSQWSLGQLVVISVLAGVGEELLFRGAIQGGLSEMIGAAPAIILAGVLFGLVHTITWAYAVMATVIGIYLGILLTLSQNVLIPIVAHALYDLVALIYYLRFCGPRNRDAVST